MFTQEELQFIQQQMTVTARQAQMTLQTSMACLRKIEIMSRPPEPEPTPVEVEPVEVANGNGAAVGAG